MELSIFYGTNTRGLWYVTSIMPKDKAYIVIHAKNKEHAETQLFNMIKD
jgi:hypothetical protein